MMRAILDAYAWLLLSMPVVAAVATWRFPEWWNRHWVARERIAVGALIFGAALGVASWFVP